MKLSFFGADQCVTGSCHCLEINGKRILIDCGLQQGRDDIGNQDLPFEAETIDYVLVTHAHIDHTGRIPLLVRQGFTGQIWTTRLTARLMEIMLIDSAYIQQSDAEYTNRKHMRAGLPPVEPIYTIEDAQRVQGYVHTRRYGVPFQLCEGVMVTFSDAGHLLGSASITIDAEEDGEERTIVFSGDIGNINQPIIRDPVLLTRGDYVVMESTYGDRNHQEVWSYTSELAQVIERALGRGGNVVIPAFAVGRTQELLYYFRHIKTQRLIRGHENFEVYVDSPLAVEATHVFKQNQVECYDEETRDLVRMGINPISFPGLKLSVSSEESKNINFDPSPKVIISASGMCDAGRIRHHLKHNLWRRECTVIFAGYQAEGTLGRSLTDGNRTVKLFGETIDVEAHIETLHDISGHADRDGLLEWVEHFDKKPDQIFVVHGSDEVCDEFAELVTERTGIPAKAPFSGAEYDLIAGEWVKETVGVPIVTKSAATRKAKGIFARLLAAGERLMAVIARNEGGTNKDLAKFADQINSLCDKWDR